jgi:hypothetical protein
MSGIARTFKDSLKRWVDEDVTTRGQEGKQGSDVKEGDAEEGKMKAN